MSTNLNCLLLEWGGKWYYVLEWYDAPKNAWDWTDYATVTGPFPTEEAAYRHLRDNNANPGGSATLREEEVISEARRAHWTQKVSEAQSPRRSSGTWGWRRGY